MDFMDLINRQKEFLELLEPNLEKLNRFARALSYNREDAKDLVSETLLQAYEGFDKVRNKQAFASYLFTIASRLHKKQNWRKRFFGVFDFSQAENIPAQETAADIKLDVEYLYKAIKKLPIKQQEAIILFEISGFSIEEITNIQGGSISGVKSRLKRAREKLADLLKDEPITENTDRLKIIKLYIEPEKNSDESLNSSFSAPEISKSKILSL